VADFLQLFIHNAHIEKLDPSQTRWMMKRAATRTGVPQQLHQLLGRETGEHGFTLPFRFHHQGATAKVRVLHVGISEKFEKTLNATQGS
jgi:hypothetical protein